MKWTDFPKVEFGKGLEGRILAIPLAKDRGFAREMIGTAPVDDDFYKGEARMIEYQNKIIVAVGVEKDEARKFGSKAWKAVESFLGPVKFHLVPDFLDEEKTLEGALLGAYHFSKYFTEKKERPWIVFHGSEKSLKNALVKARATYIARDLTNEPTNNRSPENFAEMVRGLFQGTQVKVTVYTQSWLKEKGFGGVIAVGQGSDNKPHLIVMEYTAAQGKPVLLVGKGVAFDSGGIHLKPTGYIENMKTDLAGGACVVGAMWGASELGLKKNIVAIVPAVENMPSGGAIKPGDVVEMYNKKTVEIGNTDAEGRMILADALAYGIEKYDPEYSLDVATLTGACVVALGERIAGIMGNDKEMINEIIKSGKETEEEFWELPMAGHFVKLLKSSVADLKNCSEKGYGGASIAAKFIEEFVKGKWAHLDIAGPAVAKSGWLWNPADGTGFGTRTVIEWIKSLSQ